MFANLSIGRFPSTRPSILRARWYEWRATQPELSSAAIVCVLAVVPCLLAMLVDPRTVNGINVWIKPAKFFASLAIYFATLAWAFRFLPREAQFTRGGRFVIRASLATAAIEMTWLLPAAANGVPSHFNPAPLWRAAYGVAGACAVILVTTIFVQGMMIARQTKEAVAPVMRWALVAGALVASIGTLLVAGYLSARGAHWVGGTHNDIGGLRVMGWSRDGGDLRVAHFWALHAQQIIPAIGWLLAASGRVRARRAIVVFAIGYVALIAFVFVQALNGQPFLPSLH